MNKMKDLVLEAVKAFPVWPSSGWGMIRSEDRVIALCLESCDEDECNFCEGKFYQAGTKCDIDLWQIACTREQHIRKRVEFFEGAPEGSTDLDYYSSGHSKWLKLDCDDTFWDGNEWCVFYLDGRENLIPRPTPEELAYIAEINEKDKEDKKVNIDWSKAPEGATHYCSGTNSFHDGYYKRDNTCVYKWCNTLWMAYTNDFQWFEEKCKLIPNESQWQNGLPPVGLECEFRGKSVGIKLNFRKITPLFFGKLYFVYLDDDGSEEVGHCISEYEFRPLKTQAEIDREYLIRILCGGHPEIEIKALDDCWGEIADRVINAGYKPNAPTT